MEYLLPQTCFPKSYYNLIYLDKICFLIREKLSLENILFANIKEEIFRRIIFDENELELFNNIPKLKLEKLEDIKIFTNQFFNLPFFLNYKKFEKVEKVNKIIEYYN